MTPSPEELAGLLIESMKRKGVLFPNHMAEVDAVLLVRDVIATDREAQNKEPTARFIDAGQ